jgi:predicted NAD/FAD-dependent oxidoreductase
MLIPRIDLTALFPAPAAAYVTARAGEVRTGSTVSGLSVDPDGVNVASASTVERFAAVLVAVGPHQLAHLLGSTGHAATSAAVTSVAAFAYEPIYTTYLHYPRPLGAPLPMLKLHGDPGQWLFDRGQLGGAPGLAAVVISTDMPAARVEHGVLTQAIDAQLRRLIPDLPAPAWAQTIAERRATYACVAALARPAPGALQPRLHLAGDYTDAAFPATLEAATRSGVAAARQILAARS